MFDLTHIMITEALMVVSFIGGYWMKARGVAALTPVVQAEVQKVKDKVEGHVQ